MNLRQKKKNYKKEYGRNPFQKADGSYIFKEPKKAVAICVGSHINAGIMNVLKALDEKLDRMDEAE